ncbi:MAG: hypothetical protein ACSLE2_12850 [Lysobacterales bacterium]
MNLRETIYGGDGKPLGEIVLDARSGHVAFRPREGIEAPPTRLWANVEDLRAAMAALHGDPRKLARHGTG